MGKYPINEIYRLASSADHIPEHLLGNFARAHFLQHRNNYPGGRQRLVATGSAAGTKRACARRFSFEDLYQACLPLVAPFDIFGNLAGFPV